MNFKIRQKNNYVDIQHVCNKLQNFDDSLQYVVNKIISNIKDQHDIN